MHREPTLLRKRAQIFKFGCSLYKKWIKRDRLFKKSDNAREGKPLSIECISRL